MINGSSILIDYDYFYSFALYPCEKTETGKLFRLGDAKNGIDVNRPKRLMEFMRLPGDCGNCVAKELCTKCPATVKELGTSGRPDAAQYQTTCAAMVVSMKQQLEVYTFAMERNENNVNRLFTAGTPAKPDFLEQVSVVLTPEQRTREERELGVEQISISAD